MDRVYLIVTVIVQLDIVLNQPNESREYCERATFLAECASDEVVLMQSAQYGRMALGECLTKKYEETVCSEDVRNYFDSMCSGRERCEVKVHNLLDYETKCKNNNLRSHLIANYTCVKVYQPKKECIPADKPLISHSTAGYLSSYVTTKTACGTIDSPWVLKAPKRHRINLTFIDFSRNTKNTPYEVKNCRVLVIIRDIGGINGDTSETICGGLERKRHVFRRMAEEVEIRFVPRHNDEDEVHFLVKYEVSGCSELSIARGTELIYTVDGAVIKCNGLKTWEITCKNNQWHGIWQNCSADGHAVSKESIASVMRTTVMSLPYGTAILLVVSIALAIGGCVLLMGLCYVRRRRRQRLESNIGLAAQGRLPKHLDRLPPPYEDTSYTVPDVNNSYQHSWAQHDQQYRHAHLMSTNMNNTNNNVSAANPDSYQQRYVEHIYESPNFYRKEYESKSAPQSLQYYEVETTHVKT